MKKSMSGNDICILCGKRLYEEELGENYCRLCRQGELLFKACNENPSLRMTKSQKRLWKRFLKKAKPREQPAECVGCGERLTKGELNRNGYCIDCRSEQNFKASLGDPSLYMTTEERRRWHKTLESLTESHYRITKFSLLFLALLLILLVGFGSTVVAFFLYYYEMTKILLFATLLLLTGWFLLAKKTL
jgi:hypothetical protein